MEHVHTLIFLHELSASPTTKNIFFLVHGIKTDKTLIVTNVCITFVLEDNNQVSSSRSPQLSFRVASVLYYLTEKCYCSIHKCY